MSTQMQAVLDAAMQLPEAERGELAARLMDTLDETEEAAWAEELRRRIDDARSGQATTVPWEVVRQKMVDINNAADFHEGWDDEIRPRLEDYRRG